MKSERIKRIAFFSIFSQLFTNFGRQHIYSIDLKDHYWKKLFQSIDVKHEKKNKKKKTNKKLNSTSFFINHRFTVHIFRHIIEIVLEDFLFFFFVLMYKINITHYQLLLKDGENEVRKNSFHVFFLTFTKEI